MADKITLSEKLKREFKVSAIKIYQAHINLDTKKLKSDDLIEINAFNYIQKRPNARFKKKAINK